MPILQKGISSRVGREEYDEEHASEYAWRFLRSLAFVILAVMLLGQLLMSSTAHACSVTATVTSEFSINAPTNVTFGAEDGTPIPSAQNIRLERALSSCRALFPQMEHDRQYVDCFQQYLLDSHSYHIQLILEF